MWQLGNSWPPKGIRSVWGRSVKCLGLIAGVSVCRLIPSPYCLFCHFFAVFLPFASVRKRKGNGCYAGYCSYRKPRWWRSNSFIRPKNMGTRVWYLWYSWRNSFSKREIETLRHWVSCLYFLWVLELWWKCKQLQTQNLKTFGDALSCGVAGQNFIVSRNICYSVVDLTLDSKCGHMYRKKALPTLWQFKCLSWKMCCPVQVIVN